MADFTRIWGLPLDFVVFHQELDADVYGHLGWAFFILQQNAEEMRRFVALKSALSVWYDSSVTSLVCLITQFSGWELSKNELALDAKHDFLFQVQEDNHVCVAWLELQAHRLVSLTGVVWPYDSGTLTIFPADHLT